MRFPRRSEVGRQVIRGGTLAKEPNCNEGRSVSAANDTGRMTLRFPATGPGLDRGLFSVWEQALHRGYGHRLMHVRANNASINDKNAYKR